METVLERNRSVTLHNISWHSYKQIADALQDRTPAHLTYNDGNLEIMTLSFEHENLKRLVALIFERLADDLEIDFCPAGSTTFQKEAVEKGFEPDESYYVQNADYMRGRKVVNLDFDPPPDISIEIDISRSSLNRMSIFAAIGVGEVWRYSGSELHFFALNNGVYESIDESQILRRVGKMAVAELLEIGLFATRKEFLKHLDLYAKKLKELK